MVIFTLFACLRPNPLVYCSPLLFQLFKCGADSVAGNSCSTLNCTIFLCSLDVGIKDKQCRVPSLKEKDHLAG